LGLLLLAGAAFALAPREAGNTAQASTSPSARFAEVQTILQLRCVACHAPQPAFAGFTAPPKGVLLDTPEHILAHTASMQTQLVTRVMPVGNLTQMTDTERAAVLAWLADGAPH